MLELVAATAATFSEREVNERKERQVADVAIAEGVDVRAGCCCCCCCCCGF